jgi:hypothetical protein
MTTVFPPIAPPIRAALRLRTALGLVVCVGGWSTLWMQALIGFFVVPSELAAAAFLAGLAIGARPMRAAGSPRNRRRSPGEVQ